MALTKKDLIQPIWLSRDAMQLSHWYPRGWNESVCGRSKGIGRQGEFHSEPCQRCVSVLHHLWKTNMRET